MFQEAAAGFSEESSCGRLRRSSVIRDLFSWTQQVQWSPAEDKDSTGLVLVQLQTAVGSRWQNQFSWPNSTLLPPDRVRGFSSESANSTTSQQCGHLLRLSYNFPHCRHWRHQIYIMQQRKTPSVTLNIWNHFNIKRSFKVQCWRSWQWKRRHWVHRQSPHCWLLVEQFGKVRNSNVK